MGSIVRIGVSLGGVPKRSIETVQITSDGLAGDWQKDRKHHGGPDRAVSAIAIELIEKLQAEGHPIEAGTTGENLTLRGIPWGSLQPGAVLEFTGGVRLEMTSFAPPCRTIGNSFTMREFSRISEKLHPGESRVYFKVLRGGDVRVGDECRVT